LAAALLALVLAKSIKCGDLFSADSGSQVAQRSFDRGKSGDDANAMAAAALGLRGRL
jgi:hypothetical protein